MDFSRFPTKIDDPNTFINLNPKYNLLEGYIEYNNLNFNLFSDLLSKPNIVI